jgi:hypothetical protein
VTTVDDNTLRIVAQRIAERAGAYGMASNGARSVTLKPFHAASTYPLYLAEIPSAPGKPQRVVVKFAPIFGQHREGQAEYKNLCAMAAKLGPTSALRVPRPLDYWEDVNALVTEHRPGPRFSDRLLATPWFASARTRTALARTAEQCGAWLRLYHAATAIEDGPAVDDRFVMAVQRDLDRLPARGTLAALRAPIETLVAGPFQQLRGHRVPVSVRHGDFSPDNVHLDGAGICVFDLSHHATAPVYDDVTYFLVTLDTMNPYPRYWTFDRRVARGLADPFLGGYFGAGRAQREKDDARVIGAHMVKNLLRRCLRQRQIAARAGRPGLAAFDALWVRSRYRELFARACARAAR